jgi:hypothetical protein
MSEKILNFKPKEPEETKKTQEELRAELEAEMKKHHEEYETFLGELKNNPDQPVTNANLFKAISFIANDIESIGQMSMTSAQNEQYLYNQFSALMQLLQQGNQEPRLTKTKSGIILPGI